jgi:hypothetical protein
MARASYPTKNLIGAGAATAALLGTGLIALNWLRYGKTNPKRGLPDQILDQFMPSYEVREYHETRVAAPADLAFTVARELDMQGSGLVRAIFKGRELLMGAAPGERRQPQSLLSEVLALGWRILAEEPGRELVLGAVTRPWEAEVKFRGLPPEEFAEFQEPGYAKIAWTMVVEATGPDSSIFRTETRVATTDSESRRRFRRYWSMVSPGVVLIRREMLRLVRLEAGRRHRSSSLVAALPCVSNNRTAS